MLRNTPPGTEFTLVVSFPVTGRNDVISISANDTLRYHTLVLSKAEVAAITD
jgi:hypothetical protein